MSRKIEEFDEHLVEVAANPLTVGAVQVLTPDGDVDEGAMGIGHEIYSVAWALLDDEGKWHQRFVWRVNKGATREEVASLLLAVTGAGEGIRQLLLKMDQQHQRRN